MKKIIKKTQQFDSINVRLSSPEDVLSWSHGEVTSPETIHYRTQVPERDGLFCEKIFGPETDFQCRCGKYKGSQHHGIVCIECGVEVTRALVRRERMGHIDLAVPVAHFWYLNKVPSKISTMLGMPAQELHSVVYFSAYYVIDVDEKERKKIATMLKKEFDEKIAGAEQKETRDMLVNLYEDRLKDLNSIKKDTVINEEVYEQMNVQFSRFFTADKGGQVIYNLLKGIDLKKEEEEIIKEMEGASKMREEKLRKRLLLIRSFIQSGNRPEWMFLTCLPVIPPGIRPVLMLDNGQYASSDLNDLYRAVIIRNNRLKDFIAKKTPEIFINTEKRLLQEAVDALFEKSMVGKGKSWIQMKGKNRKLKSLSEYLGGKGGYFRHNLLGKRVDFTGRSVIVAGPNLKLNEFGLPKKMALEIFRPFVIGEALARELAYNVRAAQRLIDTEEPIVWELLETVMVGKYMLLNRAPTLHRQGIMAFKPILIEGLSIELHPLVCSPYNADFDGDAMVVHLPLSEEAQAEAKNIIVSSNNIINPATGDINISPATQDILLGCYWATSVRESEEEKVRYYGSISDALTAYDFGNIHLREKIRVHMPDTEKYSELEDRTIETTAGRIFFNMCLPKEYPFVNFRINKKKLNNIVQDVLRRYGSEVLVKHLDPLKDFGLQHASRSGITFSWHDLKRPDTCEGDIEKGYAYSQDLFSQYEEGYISLGERKRKNAANWQKLREKLTVDSEGIMSDYSSIGSMIRSGARGSLDDLGGIVAMFGVMESASSGQIEQPVISSLKQGMSSIEYFCASFGARKTLADTAIKTGNAGYLSRKLFSVAQEVKVEENDCKVKKGGFTLYRETKSGVSASFRKRIRGRYAAESITNASGEVVVKKNQYINFNVSSVIENDESIKSVKVRSPLTCQSSVGVCSKCYGEDRATGELIDVGEAVGTIASQSVGEPGTQLTMRTFHAGGVATGKGDITTGLPRVTELFERFEPKARAVIAHVDGVVENIEKSEFEVNTIHLSAEGKKVSTADVKYVVPSSRFIEVKKGDTVKKGQFLTDGTADLQELLQYAGKEATQEYIFSEIMKIYDLQGINITPVHFEIIIRQMFSRVCITDPGEGNYMAGEVIQVNELIEENKVLEDKGRKVMHFKDMVSGISSIAASRKNWLSAASFQRTTDVLIRAAIDGTKDTLDGVKENVIVGRLVPVGSGFEGSKKYEMVKKVRDDVMKRIEEKKSSNQSADTV